MAPKKKKVKKKPVKRGKQKNSRGWLFPFSLFFMLTITMMGVVYFVFLEPGTQEPIGPLSREVIDSSAKVKAVRPAPNHDLVFEEPLISPSIISPAQHKKLVQTHNSKPLVAIVIDDMGDRRQTGQKLIDLSLPLSFAFLPYAPHTKYLMLSCAENQKDILLHQPMEPVSPKFDPGEGAVFVCMSASEIEKTISKNLEMVPLAVGVNNHMGSKFTADKSAMTAALSPLVAKKLFFLDSVTIAQTKGFEVAHALGLASGKRTVFLDNVQTEEAVMGQLQHLVALAQKQGVAIGIGHPYHATFLAIQANIQWLDQQVKIVPVSQLMN